MCKAQTQAKPSGPLNFCCPYSNSFLGGVQWSQIRGHKQVGHVPSLVHYRSMAKFKVSSKAMYVRLNNVNCK